MADQACILVPGQPEESRTVNWMPFGIAYDGSASTASQYFNPQEQQPDGTSTSGKNSSGQWTAYFRGRQLKGTDKTLPEGFTGLVLKPTGSNTSSSASDAQQRSWQATSSFRQLRLWGHDTAPAATDPLMRSIDWLALADQVHQPVSVSAVDEELKRMEAEGLV